MGKIWAQMRTKIRRVIGYAQTQMEEGDDTADFVPIPNPDEPRRIFLLSEMGWATGDALTPQSSNR
jgi:hypothetical protein